MEKFTIDRKNKLFRFEDGSTAPIAEENIPEVTGNVAGKNPRGLQIKEATKEKLRESKKKTGLGSDVLSSIDTFLEQAQPGFVSKPADYLTAIAEAYQNKSKSERPFLQRVHEEYAPRREARKEFKEELTQKEPIASYAGKALGLGEEIAATAGLPGIAAAPLLGALESETSILEPGKAALEAVADAALGYGLDKFVGIFGKLAGKRGARQAEKAGIAEIESKNALRQEATNKLNAQEANRFAKETAAREAQIAGMPAQQAATQQAFSQNVGQNIAKVADILGDAKIPDAALGLENFIVENVERSALAGTPEANRFSKFIQTIFNSNGKGVDKNHLNKAFQAIEGRIAQTEGAEKQLLLDFKDQMAQTLSQVVPEAKIFHKYAEPLSKELVKDVEGLVKQTVSRNSAELLSDISKSMKQDFSKGLQETLTNDIQSIFQKYTGNFSEAVENGTLINELRQAISNNPMIQAVRNNGKAFLSKRKIKDLENMNVPVEMTHFFKNYQSLVQDLDDLPKLLLRNFEGNLGKKANKIGVDKVFETQEINKILPNIQGAPQAIPQPAPVNPALNVQPNLEQVPQLSQGQGIGQTFANFLEDTNIRGQLSKLKDLFGGKGSATSAGIVAKMAGVPIAKTLGAAGAGLLGANVLTNPGVRGTHARTMLKQGLLQAYLVSRAQGYPSFRSGILDDPNDRKMFARDIEDDPSLSLEDKAMMQTKVNRGIPLD